jgi:hypothetical protein
MTTSVLQASYRCYARDFYVIWRASPRGRHETVFASFREFVNIRDFVTVATPLCPPETRRFARGVPWHVFGSLNAREAREELDTQVYPSLRRGKKVMLKIVRSANPDFVLFTLSGHIDAEHAAELQGAFDGEALPTVLDLLEVKRVDREVVADLARWNADGIKFENCPAYLREWIARTQKDPP